MGNEGIGSVRETGEYGGAEYVWRCGGGGDHVIIVNDINKKGLEEGLSVAFVIMLYTLAKF